MNELDNDQLDNLESALAVFNRGDGVAKARLLAALTAEVPPDVRPLFWKTRFNVIRKPILRLTAAAALLLTGFALWQVARPVPLYAKAAKAMIEAKGYRCDFLMLDPKAQAAPTTPGIFRLFWSATGEERTESLEGKSIRSVEIRRPGNNGLMIMPQAKQYQVTAMQNPGAFSFGLFSRLNEFRGEAKSALGSKELNGVKVEGFVLPYTSVIKDDASPNATMSVWLDSATSLPVRVDLEGLDPTGARTIRLENFHWGEQDKSLFDVTPTTGFTKLERPNPKVDQITEWVTLGLSTFAKYNAGHYPAVTNVYGDQQREALRKLMGMPDNAPSGVPPDKNLTWKNPKDGEFAHATFGLSWINTLQRQFPECVYNGKTVAAKNAGKVLLRWKLEDDRYRVIFGDLKAESVSPDRLKELEAK